ncbi:MAG: hypothetical protein ACRCX4_13570 [Bacteroidales bacterium]
MNSKIALFYSFLLGVCLLFACSQDIQSPSNEAGNISFKLNFTDLLSKAENTTEIGCYSNKTLSELASDNALFAVFVIDGKQHEINIRNINGDFVADPFMLTMGEHQLSSFIVIERRESVEKILFATPKRGSEFASFLPESALLDMTITISPKEVYTKFRFPVWVLCVENVNAEKFGYIKWEVNYTRILCLPFSVNICNPEDEHIIGTGTLRLFRDGNFEDNIYTQKGERLIRTIYFPAGADKLADFCIPDELKTDNTKEYYKYILTINNGKRSLVLYGTANVATLLSYATAPGSIWDPQLKYLHFDLCRNDASWFLKETN